MWAALKYFWICWILTNDSYYHYVFLIIQLITTICFAIQSIAINIFFAIIAVRKFEDVIHIRYVLIITIIVIILECFMITTEFIFISFWVYWIIVSIVSQIRIRLEIEILVYIVEDACHVTRIV